MKSLFRPQISAHSDPRHMSSFREPQYSPPQNNADQFLGILPNIYNPARPLPVNLHPVQIMKMYEILDMSPQECEQMMAQQQQAEDDRDLYGGSTNPIPPDQ